MPQTTATQKPPLDSIDESALAKKNPQNELIARPRKPGQRSWTPAQRHEAAMRARRHKPWLQSSGPRSSLGKAISSKNSYKHGLSGALMIELKHLMREQDRFLKGLNRQITTARTRTAIKNVESPCNFAPLPAITTPTINLAGPKGITGWLYIREEKIMPFYETVFIARQDLSDAQVKAITEAAEKIITDAKGKVTKTENWGLRTLAYKINKNKKGHYVLIECDAPAPAVIEMERTIRLNEDVVRYMTIKLDELSKGPSKPIDKNTDDYDDRPKFGDDRGDRGDRGDRSNKFEKDAA